MELKAANRSNAQENVSDEVSRAPKTVAPLCVCGGGRLCGDNFAECFALFLESRHFLAGANQQVAIKGELGFVSDRAVAGDDNHRIRDSREVRFGSANHAVDATAGGIVDKRIVAVPERISDQY